MNRRTLSLAVGTAVAAAVALLLVPPLRADSTFKIVYSFSGGAGGLTPAYGLIWDKVGNLYGVAGGGTKGYGLVFELSPASTGWTETVLHDFDWYHDGEVPLGILTLDPHGNLYGVTTQGPPSKQGEYDGVVFELSRGSDGQWTEDILCMFIGGTPHSGYVRDQAGNLYGNNDFTDELSPRKDGKWEHRTIARASSIFSAATLKGGSLYDAGGVGRYSEGMVYQLIPAKGGKWQQIDLYDFKDKGADPTAGVVFDSKGNIYGATGGGGTYSNACWTYGGEFGCGTVFKLTPTAHGQWKETVLHRFESAYDGFGPGNTLTIDNAGNLYGVAAGGINGYGVLFKLSPGTDGKWNYSVLHRFTDAKDDGAWPDTTMVFDKEQKHLYGTTLYGGAYNSGTVFEITP